MAYTQIRAHRLAGGGISYNLVALRCACGFVADGRGGAAAIAAYRRHRALATSRAARVSPATATTSGPARVISIAGHTNTKGR